MEARSHVAENKTKPTDASVEDYIASRANAQQRVDCEGLTVLLAKLTGEPPVVGFAIRGRELVLYLTAESEAQQALLARLGPHKMGKSCLYLKRLADLDVGVLEQLVSGSVTEVRRRYG
jgi:hypothetical protein